MAKLGSLPFSLKLLILAALLLGAYFLNPLFGWGVLIGMFIVGLLAHILLEGVID